MDIDVLVALSRESSTNIGKLIQRDDAVGAAVRDLSARAATDFARATLSAGSETLRDFAAKIDIPAQEAKPGADLKRLTLEALRKAKAPDNILNEASDLLGGLAQD